MSPDEFISAAASLGLPWTTLAAMLQRSEHQLWCWRRGTTPIPHWVAGELARIKAEAGRLKPAKPNGHYGEWCRKPEACAGKSYCPLDPNCAD